MIFVLFVCAIFPKRSLFFACFSYFTLKKEDTPILFAYFAYF